MWKSLERFSTQPSAHGCAVYRISETVNFRAPLDWPEGFTSFLIMNVLEKPLTSAQTIVELVEKSVQIPVRLAQFRNLINRMQHSCVVFAAELPPDLR